MLRRYTHSLILRKLIQHQKIPSKFSPPTSTGWMVAHYATVSSVVNETEKNDKEGEHDINHYQHLLEEFEDVTKELGTNSADTKSFMGPRRSYRCRELKLKGEWSCPHCTNWNFAFTHLGEEVRQCSECGEEKPVDVEVKVYGLHEKTTEKGNNHQIEKKTQVDDKGGEEKKTEGEHQQGNNMSASLFGMPPVDDEIYRKDVFPKREPKNNHHPNYKATGGSKFKNPAGGFSSSRDQSKGGEAKQEYLDAQMASGFAASKASPHSSPNPKPRVPTPSSSSSSGVRINLPGLKLPSRQQQPSEVEKGASSTSPDWKQKFSKDEQCWRCSGCNANNFSYRKTCFKCAQGKP